MKLLPLAPLAALAATDLRVERLKELNSKLGLIEDDFLWTEWKKLFNKKYHSVIEDIDKKTTFINNLIKIKSHNNSGKHSYRIGLNQFSDMTDKEFADQILMTPQLPYPEEDMEWECPHKFQGADIPPQYANDLDWRDASKNPRDRVAVTPVKNQANCGSCYSFSATASMESSLCMNGYQDCTTWAGLSEQQVLDCGSYIMKYDDTDRPHYGFNGCAGGWQSNAWQYMHWNRGIMNDADYPYESGVSDAFPDSKLNVGECRYDHSKAVAVPDKIICGTTNKDRPDAKLLKEAVYAKGAVAIGMYVGGDFRSVIDGIYVPGPDDCPNLETTGINHALTIVGYGQDSTTKQDYWIVKNSWDVTYAEGGYVKVAAGKNYCGIEGNTGYTEANNNVPESGATSVSLSVAGMLLAYNLL